MQCYKSLLTIILLTAFSCTATRKTSADPIKYILTEAEKIKLITETKSMMDLDQKYRSILALGTMNPELVKKNTEMSEKATLEEYMAFLKTIKKDITQPQSDSLQKLQNQLDYNNYINLKSIIANYGYPSKERLGVSEDNLFVILLHPPVQLDPKKYLNEMQSLLIKEVYAKRMEAKQFAMFVDDIKAKILNEPQIYGTINPFDTNTMKMGLPIIENLISTNKKRKEIGLVELKEGEYTLSK